MSSSHLLINRAPGIGLKAKRGGSHRASSARLSSNKSRASVSSPEAFTIGTSPQYKSLTDNQPLPGSHETSTRQESSKSPSTSTQDASPSLKKQPKIGRCIIGIDLGTTRLAIATTEELYQPGKPNRSPQVFENWIAQYQGGDKSPSTSLYYEKGRTLPVTGNSLRTLYRDRTFQPDRLIRLLKLMFHDHNNDPTIKKAQDRVQRQLDREGKTADSALHDLAQIILGELLDDRYNEISWLRQTYDRFDQLDLEIVITVPPGRSTVDHARVRQAFIQKGISSTQVFIESEPAAMFRSWVHKGENDRDWAIGKRYVICDAGGGTCCFVRYCLERLLPTLGFRQEYPSNSVAWGAEAVSDAFEELAASKIPQNLPGREEEIAEIRREFDASYKQHFGDKSEKKERINFRKIGSRDEYWHFSDAEVANCFNPCIDKLIEGLDQQLSLGKAVDYLVLGGGLVSNPYVLTRLRGHFKDLPIRQLGMDKNHVAVGAVLSRQEDNFLVDYPVTRSKGVRTLWKVDQKIKRSSIFPRLHCIIGKDDQEYFEAVEWLVKKGDRGAKVRRIASESRVENARVRYVEPNASSLEFSEQILTFDYAPGKDVWAAELEDGTFLSQDGKTSLPFEYDEEVTWSPWGREGQSNGVTIDDFDDTQDGRKILRYSIEMTVTETSTTSRAKVWSSEKLKRKTKRAVAFFSDPVSQKPIFAPQYVSSSMAQSFDFGSRKKVPRGVATTIRQLSAEPLLESQASELAGPIRNSISLQDPPPSSDSGCPAEIHPQLPDAHRTDRRSQESQACTIPRRQFIRPEKRPGADSSPLTNTHNANKSRSSSVRPTQMQGTNSQCAIGSPRNNRGCWTCFSRCSKCPGGKPTCRECAKHGLACEYGRPIWWDDEELREIEKAKNKRLIQANRNRVSPLSEGVEQRFNGNNSFAAINSVNTSNHQFAVSTAAKPPLLKPVAAVAQKRALSFHARKPPTQEGRGGSDNAMLVHTPSPKRPRHSVSGAEDRNSRTTAKVVAQGERKSSRSRAPRVLSEMRDWDDVTEDDIDHSFVPGQ